MNWLIYWAPSMSVVGDGRTAQQIISAKVVFFSQIITSALSPLWRHGRSFHCRQLFKMDSASLKHAVVQWPLFLLFWRYLPDCLRMQALLKYTVGEISLSVLKRMASFTIPKSIASWSLNHNFQVSVEMEKDRSHLFNSGRERETVMSTSVLSISALLQCTLVDERTKAFLCSTLPSQ